MGQRDSTNAPSWNECYSNAREALLPHFLHWSKPSVQGAWHMFNDCLPPSLLSATVGFAVTGSLCNNEVNSAANYIFKGTDTWLTFAHEHGHIMGAQHSFEEGQGRTLGIMDYGYDVRLGGIHQFNTRYRKEEICDKISSKIEQCAAFKTDSGTERRPSETSTPAQSLDDQECRELKGSGMSGCDGTYYRRK